jgi:hypothetical protein
MKDIIIAFIPSIVTIIGFIIGYSLIVERRKKIMEFNMKIFDIYDKISQEIIEVLTEMTSLSLKPMSYTEEEIENWKCKLSYLYFKYYIYLPQNVLLEMNCLHSCLASKGKYFYVTESNNRISKCEDISKISKFLDDVTLVAHDDRITKMLNNHGVAHFRNYLKINFQARNVIRRIDDAWGHKHLHKWTKQLKKHTLFEQDNKKLNL